MQVLEFWPGVSQSAVWYRYWYSSNVNHHIMNFWRAETPYPFVWNIKETGLSYKYRNAQLEHILLGGGGSVANARAAASATTGNFLAAKWQIEQWTLQVPRKLLDLKWQQVHSLWVFICSPFLCKLLTRVSWSNVWTKLEVILLNAWHRPKECWKVTANCGKQWAETSLFCSLSETCNFFVMFLAKIFLCRSIKLISVIFYTKPTSLCRLAGRRGFKHTHS